MSKHHPAQCTLLAAVAALAVSISLADERPRDHGEREDHHGYVLEQRFHHNRYYPPRGFVVHALPRDFVTFRRPGGEFFFSDGIWYSRRAGLSGRCATAGSDNCGSAAGIYDSLGSRPAVLLRQ
jgi:hypothetical protein